MTRPSTLDSLGLSDEREMIWDRTLQAIQRKGYQIKHPPGGASAKLGEGTFAIVFYAEHVYDKTPFAIKIFRDEEPHNLASCRREAETMRGPDFPRQFAVTAYDVWHEPGAQPFIVMEFLRGQAIDEFCRQPSLDQPRRIELVEQVLHGLKALHNHNIQHRDISAANILVDGQGKVRYLDFGLAGEIIRALRHTTIDARGNRGYSPGEVVRGEKPADAQDDIFNCGMLAIHLLTGHPAPENSTRSGDPKHLALCRRQLNDRGVCGPLARIVLRSLERPDRRYAEPGALAEALFDYRVRRPQRIRTRWITATAILVMLCAAALGWWRVEQLRRDAVLREYAALQQQVRELPYADHQAVAGPLGEAADLWQQWKQHADAGRPEEAAAALQQATGLLRQAIEISSRLARCLPRLEALGIPLSETPWIRQSAVIVRRHSELARQYQDLNRLLAEGGSEDAERAIDALQLGVIQLIRDNTEAGTATAARSQYQSLASSIPPRLEQDAGGAAVRKMADLAENAWGSGDWKQTTLLFGQAVQDLSQWLETHETDEERAARTKASEQRVAALESEQGRLRGEISRITTERDEREQRVKELENKIANITLERVGALDNLKASRDELTQESAKRRSAEGLAGQRAELITELTAEKTALEQQNVELQDKLAVLAQLKSELAQAEEQSRALSEQLAAAERQAAHWRQVAQNNAASPPPEPKTAATAPPAAGPALSTRTNSLGMELIRIPAGRYQRGAQANESQYSDEKPRHWVQISRDFEVGKFEVTQGVYLRVMGRNPSYFSSTGGGKAQFQGMDTSEFPVESVSWFDAVEFCNKLSALENVRPYYQLTDVQRSDGAITSAAVKVLGENGYRLLTEAEWEYVARAGTNTIFPWGDTLSSTQANFDGNYPYGGAAKRPYLQRTAKVGSYPPNPWGVCDTAGSVWEWVWDGYNENEYQQFSSAEARDPLGSSEALTRVLRGGSWFNYGDDCRPAYRDWFTPERRYFLAGFRVARGLSNE